MAGGLLVATIGLAFAGVSWQRDRALTEEVRSRERLAEFLFQSGLSAGGMEAVLKLAEASDLTPDASSLARLPDPAERARAGHAASVRRIAAQAYLAACPRLLSVRPVNLADWPERSLTADGWALERANRQGDPDQPGQEVVLADPDGRARHSFPGATACFDWGGERLAVDQARVFDRAGQLESHAAPFAAPRNVAGPDGQWARLESGQVRFRSGVRVAGDTVAFSPRGTALTISPFRARLVETNSGKLLWERETSSREVSAVRFSPDGSLVALALATALGSRLEVRETETGEPQGDPIQAGYTILDLDFDAGGLLLAGACSDRQVRLWTLGGFPFQLQPAAWAPPLQRAPVVWVRQDRAGLWSLSEDEDASWLYHWKLPDPPEVQAELESLPLGLRADRDRLLARTRNRLRVWRAGAIELEESLPLLEDAWLVEGGVLALETSDTLREWSSGPERNYRLPASFRALRPDGRAALLSNLQEVELATGRVLRKHQGEPGETPVVYSPDGSWAAATGPLRDQVVPLFRPDRDVVETQVRIVGLEIGPDSSSLLAWTDNLEGSAAVYLSRPGRQKPLSFRHGAWVSQAAFSSDGAWVLTTSLDGTARVLRADTLRPALPALSHGGPGLSGGGFSPDGSRFYTQDELGRLRLWDRQTGLPLSPLLPHPSELNPVFRGDDRLLLAWGPRLVLWPVLASGPGMVKRAESWTGLSLDDLP